MLAPATDVLSIANTSEHRFISDKCRNCFVKMLANPSGFAPLLPCICNHFFRNKFCDLKRPEFRGICGAKTGSKADALRVDLIRKAPKIRRFRRVRMCLLCLSWWESNPIRFSRHIFADKVSEGSAFISLQDSI